MIPIWKDKIVELSATAPSDGIAYRVALGGLTPTVVYTGRAFARPSATKITARINDIIAPLLVRGFGPAGETDTPCVTVLVQVYSSGSWSTVSTLIVFADWSYDVDFDPASDPLNAPISDVLLPGQLVPATRGDEDSSSSITFRVGYSTPTGDFNADFNEDFLVEVTDYADVTKTVGVAGTAWLDLMDYPTAVSVEVGGRIYRVGGGSCNKHALYYVNAYGAWDTLVVQGNTALSDALTRHTTERIYDNATTIARGRVNYVNELARRYTFYTQLMPEADSLKMHHLLNSPHVLVHDTVTGHVRPLVLSNGATEYKHGPRLYQYAIEAQLAQERIRR